MVCVWCGVDQIDLNVSSLSDRAAKSWLSSATRTPRAMSLLSAASIRREESAGWSSRSVDREKVGLEGEVITEATLRVFDQWSVVRCDGWW